MLTGSLTFHENPSVKQGGMRDPGQAFEAVVVTQDNSLVDKVLGRRKDGFDALTVLNVRAPTV